MSVPPSNPRGIGLVGASYHLPVASRDLRALAAAGLITGDVAPLAAFGFANARIAERESGVDMAVCAARRVLEETDTDPADVDLLLYAGALASSGLAPREPPVPGSLVSIAGVPDLFRFPASLLQRELDLDNAVVMGVGQQACASLFSAIEIGRAMLLANPVMRHVLCVASDRLPDGVHRDIVYNVVSDGACAVLLRRDAPMNRIVASHQVTRAMVYGDDEGRLDAEVVAAYFPTAVSVIEATLRKAGLGIDDIDWIIPHNVSRRSWDILLGMLHVPERKLFSANIARVGHTIAADNIINLRDAQDAGLLRAGQRLLLFTFGFGLNWSCMILEH